MHPDDMALRGRIGAYAMHAKHDARETTARARETFMARFEQEVDPEGLLEADERQRRATSARKAHFARLALRSAQARRKKIQKRNDDEAYAEGSVVFSSQA